jgi:hypothetical protein
MFRRFTLIGGALLTLLALADRALVVRDLIQMAKNLSWLSLVFLVIGLIPVLLVIAWVLDAFQKPPDPPDSP